MIKWIGASHAFCDVQVAPIVPAVLLTLSSWKMSMEGIVLLALSIVMVMADDEAVSMS